MLWDRLIYFKSIYGNVSTSNDIDAVLKNNDIDAVVIATPVHTHYHLAKKALENGKHVLFLNLRQM